ncbi:hypothetical protein FB451DRAFT_1241144 [Mycena latifolia]|nr:hypothetical protein FB451DRAFT_1241144 [Mycena latifolia]
MVEGQRHLMGVVPCERLVSLLRHGNPISRLWAIFTLATLTEYLDYVKCVAATDILARISELMESAEREVQFQACVLLFNLAWTGTPSGVRSGSSSGVRSETSSGDSRRRSDAMISSPGSRSGAKRPKRKLNAWDYPPIRIFVEIVKAVEVEEAE